MPNVYGSGSSCDSDTWDTSLRSEDMFEDDRYGPIASPPSADAISNSESRVQQEPMFDKAAQTLKQLRKTPMKAKRVTQKVKAKPSAKANSKRIAGSKGDSKRLAKMSKSKGTAQKPLSSSSSSSSKRDPPTSSSTSRQAKKAKQTTPNVTVNARIDNPFPSGGMLLFNSATGIIPRNENPRVQSDSSTIEVPLPWTPRRPLPTLAEMMAWDQFKTDIVTDADGNQVVNIQCPRLSAMGTRFPCTMLGPCVCGSFRRSCKAARKHMQQMLDTSRGR